MRILLIEADPVVARQLADALTRELIQVRTEVVAPETIEEDVVVIGLPDGDRHAICRALRAADPRRRIVMLTLDGTEAQSVAALEAGADHVVARQGVSGRELAVRLRTVARRKGGGPPARRLDEVVAGPLRVDLEARTVELDGAPIHLTDTELELLLALARRPDSLVARERLLTEIWGGRPIDERTLDSVVKRLRTRLGRTASARVETVRGAGYRLSVVG